MTTALLRTFLLCGATLLAGDAGIAGQTPVSSGAALRTETPLDTAQWLYYNGRYEEAAAEARAVEEAHPDNLAAYEVRTAALLFQIKRLIGEPKDKKAALRACTPCPDLIAAFTADIATGRSLAHARLAADPADAEAQFFLGKLDLNYIWLHLGPLGRRTGWTETRSCTRSMRRGSQASPLSVGCSFCRSSSNSWLS